ncbi:ligand-gated channel protein [Candidatus Poribacteria bacterium]|nr:MAG: ligand-gated channel protein [Candidatus Poribacteria bacterium]
MSILGNKWYFWCVVTILLGVALVMPMAASAEALKVVVQDQNGNPIPEAKVQIGTQEETTDESGNAMFSDVTGTQALTVIAIGFSSKRLNTTAGQTEVTVVLAPIQTVEAVVVVGTRSIGRRALQAPVPIEVVNREQLSLTGQSETGRVLQMLVPSFNFSSSTISDGTDALRPATLRGLGPDQTLVLVNGKRRHKSALLHVNTSVGRGTAGTDFNAIPSAAIERIEVLRDGAAAQYGSDAIAGVINIVLKDDVDTGNADIYWGQTYEGDGDTWNGNANYGMKVGESGFLNLTAEWRDRYRTNRAGLTGTQQYDWVDVDQGRPSDHIPEIENDDGTVTEKPVWFDPREYTFERQNFRIGDADSSQKVGFYNFGLPLAAGLELYSFGGHSTRQNNSAGFYRRANQASRTVPEIYPDGFLPEINTDIGDTSLALGLAWTHEATDLNIDVSINHGLNTFDFLISNSLNASYGPSSPTSADAGGFELSQTAFNLDVTYPLDYQSSLINLAGGIEFRREGYGIHAGEPLSWINAGLGVDGASGGIQVFPGFRPDNEVDESRTNIAGYADFESYLSGQPGTGLLVGAAVRGEQYSDFGATVTGKATARYDLTKQVAVRAAGSTGFRAPSLQQLYFNNISTQFKVDADDLDKDGNTEELIALEVGTFRNDSDAARALGIPELKEETAFNVSGGFVLKPLEKMWLSIDGFLIQIDDRIVLSGSFSADDITELAAAGASSAQVFTNVAQTRTQGVDVAAGYLYAFDNESLLNLRAALTWADTEVIGDVDAPEVLLGREDTLFPSQERSMIEEWQPNTRVNISADYMIGDLTIGGALRYFGSYTVQEGSGDDPARQTYGGKWLTDIQSNYQLNEGLSLTIGANNLFDQVPDLNEIGQSRGGTLTDSRGQVIVDSPGVFTYSRRSAPFGFNGGLYYAKLSYRF